MLKVAAVVALVVSGCTPQPAGSENPTSVSSQAEPRASASASEPTPANPSNDAHVTPIPDAPASGVLVHIVAENVRWEVDTLVAPAGMTWTLELENRDEEHLHNFTIADGPAFSDRIFQTAPNLPGLATETYQVPGIPPGTYEFVCTLHGVTMTGTLVVE